MSEEDSVWNSSEDREREVDLEEEVGIGIEEGRAALALAKAWIRSIVREA